MPENSSGGSEIENVRAIRQLVRLMKRYDLTAIDFREGDTQIRLRRRGPESAQMTYAPASSLMPSPAPQPPTSGNSGGVVILPPPLLSTGVTIDSPMVGTYYASSTPDAAPFVSVGTAIRADATVCVIEAMKVFTDIPAGMNGTITEILVKNGQTVEFGQPLFRVTPS